MALIDIAEVSRSTGLRASTLRYYEEIGLIESLGRRGLRRLFDSAVLHRLSLIALGRSAGLSLDEIGGMLGAGPEARIDRDLLAAKADDLDRTIRRLAAVRDGLRHAVQCPAPSHEASPTFQRYRRMALGRLRHARDARP